MKRTRFLGALIALLASAAVAHAQSYPSRPITMMVGFPPGGPTDTLARILADAMKSSLGQTIVVETVSGASGTIATGRVVHANPDGYTIGIGNWGSHVGAPAFYALDYDVLKDLQPISLLEASPLWILGKSALPPKTVERANPLAEGKIGADHIWHRGFRQRRSSVRHLFRAEDRCTVSICTLSWRCASDAGSSRRPNRSILP